MAFTTTSARLIVTVTLTNRFPLFQSGETRHRRYRARPPGDRRHWRQAAALSTTCLGNARIRLRARLSLMNAALGSRAFFLFRRRGRFWILAVRLRRHIQKPPHNALHALRDLLRGGFSATGGLFVGSRH